MSNNDSDSILPKIPSTTKKKKQIKNKSPKSNNNKNEHKSHDKTKTKNRLNIPKHPTKRGVKIIDEVTKFTNKIAVIKNKVYRINFVFNTEDYYITVKSNTLIKNIRNSICQLIGLNINKVCLIYRDAVIDESNDEKTAGVFFDLKNIKFRPIVYVKKKFSVESETSIFNIIPKNFNYKIRIQNYPINKENTYESKDSLDNIINNFFKNYYSVNNNNNNLENIYHYKIEDESLYKVEEEKEKEEEKEEKEEEENKQQQPTEPEPPTFIVCFSSQDIAFDFNRYVNMLKIINPIFKDIKSNLIMPKKVIKKTRNEQSKANTLIRYGIDYGLEDNADLMQRNCKILKLVRLNFLKKEEKKKLRKSNSQESITGLGPYLSFVEKERMQKKEEKKKWINPEGFISCVGKYSGIEL